MENKKERPEDRPRRELAYITLLQELSPTALPNTKEAGKCSPALCLEEDTGLVSILAISTTVLGPSSTYTFIVLLFLFFVFLLRQSHYVAQAGLKFVIPLFLPYECTSSPWKKMLHNMVCACHPSDSQKHKIGGSWSRLIWAKSKSLPPKKPEQKGVEVWFKWYSACLATQSSEFKPQYHQKI
jgi:hypothetical protein